MKDEVLDELRAHLDAADDALVAAAAARLDIVRKIGARKAEIGTGTFDRDRERAVLDRARRRGEDHHIDPALAECLVQMLVEHGHGLQETTLGPAAPGRILLVGGHGAMGRMLDRFLAPRGHDLPVLERDDGQDAAAVVRKADVVLVTVGMKHAAEVVRNIAAHVRDDALLCDINSLKAEVCDIYGESAHGEAIGLHPMFGPTVSSLRRQKVVVCPVRSGPRSRWFLGELAALGAELIDADPEHHDHMMSIVQVVTHFRTIATGMALARSGVSLTDSLRFTSPIYRLELAVVGRLFAQDPELYASILLDNPDGERIRRLLRQATSELDELVAAGDRKRFVNAFHQAGAWFEGFADEALTTSDAIIDTLVERA